MKYKCSPEAGYECCTMQTGNHSISCVSSSVNMYVVGVSAELNGKVNFLILVF